MKETIKISATDSYPLSVTCFTPKRFNGKIVLVNAEIGVSQHHYAEFSLWLADLGFRVYTYDYRGIGDSRSESLKHSKATLEEWGTKDYHSVLKYLFLSYPDSQFVVLGHGIGGQLVPLSPLSENLDLIVNIGSHTPSWRHQGSKLKALFFWNIILPSITKVFGYYPAKQFGLFENLPSGVALQWRHWSKSKNLMLDEKPQYKERFKSLHQPALMISFADDKVAPKAAVDEFMSFFKNLKWTNLHTNPADIAQHEIGHFGFFSRSSTTSLWFDVVNWMNRQLEMKASRAA